MLLQADAYRIPLPDKSVHSCVTSPPYWGLRKYAGEQGLEPLGLETTPERHIERMVKIFREVDRVLRDDGVVWLNYGDCYAGSGGENANTGLQGGNTINASSEDGTRSGLWRRNPRKEKITAGNLMLMPHRLAIALQDGGWIVRNDLVWFKRNPMPESVAGWRFENGKLRKSSWRHTRAHEYIFQLVKDMGYYCNQEAVRESADPRGMKKPDGWDTGEGAHGTIHRDGREKGEYTGTINSGRNPRSVLDVPTAPYKGAHYATFPPNLIAPLIRASVPRRCCPECGQAWAPVVEKSGPQGKEYWAGNWEHRGFDGTQEKETRDHKSYEGTSTILDYRPTCEHDLEPVPGIVLDPFGGSGTTGMVAKQLLRRWVVLDISRPYLDEQAKIRTRSGMPSKGLRDLPLFEMGAGDSMKGEDPCD